MLELDNNWARPKLQGQRVSSSAQIMCRRLEGERDACAFITTEMNYTVLGVIERKLPSLANNSG